MTCLQFAHYSYRLLGWKVAPGIASRLATATVQEGVVWVPNGPAATLALAGGPRMLWLPDAARGVQSMMCALVMGGSCTCSWQHTWHKDRLSPGTAKAPGLLLKSSLVPSSQGGKLVSVYLKEFQIIFTI